MSAPARDAASAIPAVDRLFAALKPGGSLETLAGTAESVEMIIEAIRSGILAEVSALVETEIADPRTNRYADPDMWGSSEGFYMALMGERLSQLLESVQAMLLLHKAGHYRPAWGLVQQATATMHRMWMLSEATVLDQPWDEARRSGKQWINAATAVGQVDGVTSFDPHPFDTVYLGQERRDEYDDLEDAVEAGHQHWLALADALEHAGRLAEVYVPGHLQIEPDAAATMPTTGTGLSSPEMIRAQCELAVALVHSAATSARGGLEASLANRES